MQRKHKTGYQLLFGGYYDEEIICAYLKKAAL